MIADISHAVSAALLSRLLAAAAAAAAAAKASAVLEALHMSSINSHARIAFECSILCLELTPVVHLGVDKNNNRISLADGRAGEGGRPASEGPCGNCARKVAAKKIECGHVGREEVGSR